VGRSSTSIPVLNYCCSVYKQFSIACCYLPAKNNTYFPLLFSVQETVLKKIFFLKLVKVLKEQLTQLVEYFAYNEKVSGSNPLLFRVNGCLHYKKLYF
jgi:hypothetical protein